MGWWIPIPGSRNPPKFGPNQIRILQNPEIPSQNKTKQPNMENDVYRGQGQSLVLDASLDGLATGV
jgi:hypothetical protein